MSKFHGNIKINKKYNLLLYYLIIRENLALYFVKMNVFLII